MFNDKLFKTVLGIEFKDDSLAAVCLKNDLSGISLLSSAIFPLKDDPDTISAIKSFIDKYRVSAGKVFVCIPDKWAIIKFTEIPLPKGKNSISQLVRYEIERHIPFQIDDVFYDFMVVDKRDSACKVALAAVHKEKIEPVKKLFERLTLRIEGINISSFAALSAIELSRIRAGGWQELAGITKRPDIFGSKGETGISVLLNKTQASIAVMKNNSCVHLKPFAPDLNSPLDALSEEISSMVKETLSALSLQRINRLILSGDMPLLNDLSDALMKKLGVRTVVVNPLATLLPLDKAREMQWLTPPLGACLSGLGLAAHKLNLLPHKTAEKAERAGSLTARAAAIIILLLGITILTGKIVTEKRSLMMLSEALRKNASEVTAVEKLSADLKTLENYRDFLLNIKKNDITLGILSEMSNIIPADAWITNLSYKESDGKEHKPTNRESEVRAELVISGYAVSSSKLISILEDSPLFEKVQFVGAIKKTPGGKEDFKIKAVVLHRQDLRVQEVKDTVNKRTKTQGLK